MKRPQYWAASLRQYHGRFDEPVIQHYINSISMKMGTYFERATPVLTIFTQVGWSTSNFYVKC